MAPALYKALIKMAHKINGLRRVSQVGQVHTLGETMFTKLSKDDEVSNLANLTIRKL